MADIEAVYADERRQLAQSIGSDAITVADALKRLANDAQWHGIDLDHAAVGVFGGLVGRDYVLKAGDRLEIYAALKIDPKAARRARARAAPRTK